MVSGISGCREASFGLAIDGAGDIRVRHHYGVVESNRPLASFKIWDDRFFKFVRQIGTLTNMLKTALLLSVIAGQDPLDSQLC